LDGGPPGFPHERPSTWYSGGRTRRPIASLTGLSPSLERLSRTASAHDRLCDSAGTSQGPAPAPTTPAQKRLRPIALSRFGLFPFRSPLLREYSLFLPLLRCFSSRTYLFGAYLIRLRVTGHYPGRVSPFGHSRITACSQLPETFRRLPRPSSALGAKASTPCPV
jgi:hypothetical protein